METRLNVISGRHVRKDGTLSKDTYTWFLPKRFDRLRVGAYVYAMTKFGSKKVVVTGRMHWDQTLEREPKLQSVLKIIRE